MRNEHNQNLTGAERELVRLDTVAQFAPFAGGITTPNVDRSHRGFDSPNTSVDTILDLAAVVSNHLDFGVQQLGEQFGARLAPLRTDPVAGVIRVSTGRGRSHSLSRQRGF
ncbi:MAG: hypothetical protein RLO46_13400 [Pseudomonadales bacterium]